MSCSLSISEKQRVSPLEFLTSTPKISLHSNLGVDASLIILSMLDSQDLLKLSGVQKAWTFPLKSMYWNTAVGANHYARRMRATKQTADSFFEFIKKYGIRRIVIQNSAPEYLIRMQHHPMLEQLSIQHSPDLNLECFRMVKDLAIREISLDNVSQVTGAWFQEGFQCLSKLNIKDCEEINDVALNLISSKKTIQSLTIYDCEKITDLGIQCLASLEQMTELNLYRCFELTDKSLEYLKDLPLVQLDLRVCWRITLCGLTFLLNNPLTMVTYRNNDCYPYVGFDYISVKKLDAIKKELL